MKNFDRGNRPSYRDNREFGKKNFGGGRKFGDYNDGPKQMYSATCSECRQDCEVPFRPTGERPVFCSNCFEKKKSFTPARSGGNKFSRPNFIDKPQFKNEQLDLLNIKLDKILQLLNKILITDVNVSQQETELESPKKEKKAKSTGKKAIVKKKK